MDPAELDRLFVQEPRDEGDIFLDHLAHFVPDMDTAAAEFVKAGFTMTPLCPQRTQHGPAGTANRCIMLREGYVEVLTPMGRATALSQQMNAAIMRYPGVHLLAFSMTDLAAKADALKADGFRLQPLVELERTVEAEDGGEADLRFSVLRLAPGQMAEGRTQYLTHHTVDALWQDRFVDHENGAVTLISALVTVESVSEAADRYRRFFGRREVNLPPLSARQAVRFELERGAITLTNPEIGLHGAAHGPLPGLPCMPAYTLGFRDLDATVDLWRERGFNVVEAMCGGLAIHCAGASIIGFQA